MYAIAEHAHKRLQRAFALKIQDRALSQTRARLRHVTSEYAALVRQYQEYRLQADMKNAAVNIR